MSCSSKRKMAAGSCISTFVSSTYRRRCASPAGSVAEGFEDFLGMACNLHLAPFVAQNTGTVDQERAAFDTHVLAAVQAFLADDVEEPAELLLHITQQMEGQGFLVAKFVVGLEAVAGYAQHHGSGAPELRMQ